MKLKVFVIHMVYSINRIASHVNQLIMIKPIITTNVLLVVVYVL